VYEASLGEAQLKRGDYSGEVIGAELSDERGGLTVLDAIAIDDLTLACAQKGLILRKSRIQYRRINAKYDLEAVHQ
jgi:hypothetical protein